VVQKSSIALENTDPSLQFAYVIGCAALKNPGFC